MQGIGKVLDVSSAEYEGTQLGRINSRTDNGLSKPIWFPARNKFVLEFLIRHVMHEGISHIR